MGAKTSRASRLETRWQKIIADGEEWEWGEPPAHVYDFLEQNVAGYSHDSIAEMAETFVHVYGMGWPAAYLLTDFPLFVGQEVSTRAVDMTKSKAPCRFAHPLTFELHDAWRDVFLDLKEELDQRGGYKFDRIRWALPGTTPTGVTFAGKVRPFVRQLETIQSLGENYDQLARMFFAGMEAYAPVCTAAVRKRVRQHSCLWEPPRMRVSPREAFHLTEKGRAVEVTPYGSVRTLDTVRRRVAPRPKAGEHLDKAYRMLGQFKLTIRCSVAAARDWHRHRACMPWSITVPTTQQDELFMSPFYPEMEKHQALWEETSRVYHMLSHDDPAWDALHALPFGTSVIMECVCALPELLYMLELRYGASGANFEYKEQARQGLLELANALGDKAAEDLHILGLLK